MSKRMNYHDRVKLRRVDLDMILILVPMREIVIA